MNIFQTQMDLSNEVKQLSPVKLPPFNSSEFLRISKRRREAVHRKTVFSHFQEIHTDLETGKACDTELHLFKHSCMQKIPGIS